MNDTAVKFQMYVNWRRRMMKAKLLAVHRTALWTTFLCDMAPSRLENSQGNFLQ